MTIVQFIKDGAFGPDDIQAMSMALDEVCKTLNLTDRATVEREIIAERIIALARNGERSPTLLRDRVLREAGLADGNGADGNGAMSNGRRSNP